jgi:hypothetical protein
MLQNTNIRFSQTALRMRLQAIAVNLHGTKLTQRSPIRALGTMF